MLMGWLFAPVILLKLFLLRSYVFPQSFGLHLLLLETASVVLIFYLLGFARPRKAKLYWLADFIFSGYFLANVIYHSYFGSLFNLNALLQAAAIKDLGPSILELFSLKYLLFYFDFLVLMLPKMFLQRLRRPHFLNIFAFSNRKLFPRFLAAVCLVIALAAISDSVLAYPDKDNRMAMARDVGILNAQGYEFVTILPIKNKKTLPPTQMNQAVINEIKQIDPAHWPKYFGAGAGKNLILIQLEATENFVIGLKVQGQEITPNLNNLRKESFYFPNFYSQIGQGTTSDAEFITNTSLYPQARGPAPRDINYPSLPRLLKTEGYTSVTFHPNTVTYWSRNLLYPSLGFDQYYDKKYFQDEDMLGRWGSSDEVLFRKTLPVLKNLQDNGQLFYASIITMSSHHPFTLPENKKHLTLPPGLDGTFVGNYLASVNYADYALGLFIRELKASSLWDNSIIVIFGDHYGISGSAATQNINIFTQLLGRSHDAVDGLNVPLFIRIPGLKPQVIENPGGQIDLLPTLANLLDIPLKDQLTFGQDMLNHSQNLLGFRFLHPEGTFIDGQAFYRAGNQGGLELNTRKPIQNEQYFREEEQRIKQLLQLSDNWVESLRQSSK